MTAAAIGVMGGSGLYELEGLGDVRWRRVRTPFGDPSDEYCTGTFEGRPVVFLARHGRGHRLTPSELNFRANIWGLKSLGAEWVISVSAVGSMKETIHPLDVVVPSQFFDATRRRISTFFGEGIGAGKGRRPLALRRRRSSPIFTLRDDTVKESDAGAGKGGCWRCHTSSRFRHQCFFGCIRVF